jgi:flagellar motor switch protein FliG
MGAELAKEVGHARASKLRGVQKAAVLLSRSASSARRDLQAPRRAEVEALSLEIAKAAKVPTDVCRDVIDEAVESVLAEDYLAEGGVEYARSVLMRSLGGERAEEIIGRLAATIERRPFEFLRRTPPEQISVFLRNESPQTVALVISNLHTQLGAQVLSMLDDEEQAAVAMRIALMSETRPEVVAQVENVVRSRLSAVGSQEYAMAGGVKSLADILNFADRSTERNVLDELAKADSELAEEIRLLLFTFEDVVKLDDRSIQMVLKESRPEGSRDRPARRVEDVRGIFGTCPSAAPSCSEEIDFQPPQRKRVSKKRRAASSPSCAASRRPARSSSRGSGGGRAGLDGCRRIRLPRRSSRRRRPGRRRPSGHGRPRRGAAEAEQLREPALEEGYAGSRRGAGAGSRRCGAGVASSR